LPTSQFNPDLVDDLAREKVVLFLGAGVSASAVTAAGGRIAGWADFLSKLCDLCSDPLKTQATQLIQKKDYLLACEVLQSALADEWEKHLTTEFGQKASPSTLHEAIVGLRQRIILTTNFDKLLEISVESIEKTSTHYPKVISSIDDNVFKVPKDHPTRYIIKIHGTVDNISTLVFSRSEYIRLAFGNSSYSGFLENLLLNYTFLFIGFSMDDPAIISLMEMYALRYKTARPHYILTANNVDDNIATIFKRLRKLVFIKYDGKDHHVLLPSVLNDLGQEAAERRREIYATFATS
jgi:hypothetical protein